MNNHTTSQISKQKWRFSLAALGVVYGDIGTSPLYAFRESILGLPVNATSIYGALSLIFWSLIIVVSIKYLMLLLETDNHGEGGILALLALIKRKIPGKSWLLFGVAIFGSGLLLGDGMLTPAISVLSAIEGIDVFLPQLSHWIIPLTCLILIALFYVQASGTSKIGNIFGPIILIWFITIAMLGIQEIIKHPHILYALNPYYAVRFITHFGWQGYLLLGGIFLVLTGGEALYTDLGHFGKSPIRISWFTVVLPCLVFNYFGQGAYLLHHPQALANPFYMLCPTWFSIPLIILATCATIIASQAVISATFSLTKQAVALGYYPHISILHTSDLQPGQVFVPQMNFILTIGTVILILLFKSSNALTHAYGIAVNLVMFLTTLLVFYLTFKTKRMHPILSVLIYSIFGIIDLSFLGANLLKVHTGGWVPIGIAIICALLMLTWHQGRIYIHKHYVMKKPEIEELLNELETHLETPIPNSDSNSTAVFITNIYDKNGGYFLKFLKLNRFQPEAILLINHLVENVPYIPIEKRIHCKFLKENICRVTLQFGFLDKIDIPQTLKLSHQKGLLPYRIDFDTTSYFIESSHVVASKEQKSLLCYWQEKIFEFLSKNYTSSLNIEYFHLPFDRTIAIGAYYKI